MITAFSLMTHGLRTVHPDVSVDALIDLFMRESLSRVLVVNNAGAPVGVVAKSDVLCRQYLKADTGEFEVPQSPLSRGVLAALGAGFHMVGDEETVAEIMCPHVVAVREDATLVEVCELMIRAHVHGLPVIGAQGPSGWISAIDVVRWVASSHVRPDDRPVNGSAQV